MIITETRHLVADVLDDLAGRVQGAAIRDIDANISAGHQTVAESIALFELSLGDLLAALADGVRPVSA